jgi:hypothetical protein
MVKPVQNKVFNLVIDDVNRAPILTSTPAVLADGAEDQAYTIKLSDLLKGYSDADGDTLSVINLSANNGVLTANQDNTFTFTPDANFNGIVTLNYDVSDGKGGIINATNSLNLVPVNDAPEAVVPVDSNQTGTEGQAFSYALPMMPLLT